MKNSVLIEVAAFTPTAALTAAGGGADRIELCSGFAEGGLSPSIGSVALVRERINIPLHVMVRPRAGDFVYNPDELSAMEKEIVYYRQSGVNGVVLGILNADRTVDIEAMKRLIDIARPMSVTFHRAFDQCADPFRELALLIDCGVDRILTSGCKPSVMEGLDLLGKLVESAGNALIILPGGGVSATNAMQIVNRLGVKEIHLSGKQMVTSTILNPPADLTLCSPGEVYDFRWYECDPDQIKAVKKSLEPKVSETNYNQIGSANSDSR